jgi:uncharacterized protein involved in exopolysaccharide biosynthesis
MKSASETEVEILQSRSLAAPVVDSLRLQALIRSPRSVAPMSVFAALDLPGSFKKRTYRFTRVAGDSAAYRFEADGDSGTARVGQPARLSIGQIVLARSATAAAYKVNFFDREDAITEMLDRLTFEKLKADVAHFEYRASDSVTAAAVPNLLLDLYMQRRKGYDRGVNQKRAEFLAAKVDSVNILLTAAEHALRNQQESTGLIDPSATARLAMESEARLRQQLTDIQIQEGALQQLVTQIGEGRASARQLAAYPQYLGSGPINGIVGNLIGIETERQGLLMTRTEEDQDVRALAQRAKNLEGQLLPLAQTTLTALGTQRAEVQQKLDRMRASLLSLPVNAETFARLEREILERSRIYAALESQLVDAKLAAITEGGDVRPLDVAAVPKKPAFPKKSLTLAGGVAGGAFGGILFAVIFGVVGGRMYDAQDVERRTGLPAVHYETSAPLLVGGHQSRTVVVAPINDRARARPVAERLVETAMSRSLTATILDLSLTAPSSNGAFGSSVANRLDVNASIRQLEESHDLVVVQLPNLAGAEAAATLSDSRAVVLVAPERRIERRSLQSAIDLLQRVGSPCAGVVLHGDDRRALRA